MVRFLEKRSEEKIHKILLLWKDPLEYWCLILNGMLKILVCEKAVEK